MEAFQIVIAILMPVMTVILYVGFKRRLKRTSDEMRGNLSTTAIGVATALENYKKELRSELYNFKLSIKQYTRHKVASPQQICKARSKAGQKKVVKSREA